MPNELLYQRKEQFLSEWPVERIQTMTLEEYSSRNKNSFCYWLELLTQDLGSIWGGSSYKFGVYLRDENNTKQDTRDRYANDGRYSWMLKHGASAEEAFFTMRSLILQIIQAVQADNLDEINAIEMGDAVKWKIAFLYSNFNVVNIFKPEALRYAAQCLGMERPDRKPISEAHRYILSKKPEGQDYFDFTKPLWEAFEKKLLPPPNLLTDSVNTEQTTTMNHPLNQILYGPPGTGKTYTTVDKALQIVAPDIYLKHRHDRKKLREEYQKLLIKDFGETDKGRIGFATFHQSFSYEDFVEGIKPLLVDGKGEGGIKYRIEEGIFKRMCNLAERLGGSKAIPDQEILALSEEEFTKAAFYKLSLGDSTRTEDQEIYDYCIKEGYIAIGFTRQDLTGMSERDINTDPELRAEPSGPSMLNYFKHYLKVGNYVVITRGNKYFRAIGKVTGEYEYHPDWPIEYPHFRKVEWLNTDINVPVNELYDRIFSQRTIYKLDSAGIKKEYLVENFAKPKETTRKEPEKVVLIIDEINRGNVSQIFGELITLIEGDKRAGEKEETTIILPYSKTNFTVPANLYIIGTMNTADRSVEALDTALRRRFHFEEMAPKPELLSPANMFHKLLWDYKDIDWDDEPYISKETSFLEMVGASQELKNDRKKHWKKMLDHGSPALDQVKLLEPYAYSGLHLDRMLETINKRIAKLIDKDHCIGHSYFMGVCSWDDLTLVFQNKVIPLLQEYFFGDLGKIGLVLGPGFIKLENDTTDGLFAKFKDYEEAEMLLERKVWALKPIVDIKLCLTEAGFISKPLPSPTEVANA